MTPPTSRAKTDVRLAKRRTPLPTTNVRGTWPRTRATRDVAREATSLTRSLTHPGQRQNVLTYILGMQMIRTQTPYLMEQVRNADRADRGRILTDALQDPLLPQDILDAYGISASATTNPRTPNGLGQALAFHLGAETEAAAPLTTAPDTLRLLASASSHPGLSSAPDRDNTPIPKGFLLLPEDLLIASRANAAHPLDIRAISWAPGLTPGKERGIRITLWSQTYGQRGARDTEWDELLDAAARDDVLLPRLTYVATDWLIEGEAPAGAPREEDVRETAEGTLLVVDPTGTFPRRFLTAILALVGMGTLLVEWEPREGRSVGVLVPEEGAPSA